MSLNPYNDLKTMMPSLLSTLQQCQQIPTIPQDPNTLDVGQAIQCRDILSNLITAVQQEQSGQPKSQTKSTSPHEQDQAKQDDSQKKSQQP
jgi:hypothetical protein